MTPNIDKTRKMKQHLVIVLVAALIALIAARDVCTPTSDSCDFYLQCLEKVKPCGIAGYAMGYGDKYCNKFSQRVFHSDKAKKWLVSAKQCLQETLVPIIQNPDAYTCDQIVNIAFNSHPKCYTQKAASICSILDPRDLVSILFTVDGKDLFSRKSFIQIKDVVAICATGRSGSLAEQGEEVEYEADMLH